MFVVGMVACILFSHANNFNSSGHKQTTRQDCNVWYTDKNDKAEVYTFANSTLGMCNTPKQRSVKHLNCAWTYRLRTRLCQVEPTHFHFSTLLV